MDTIECAKFSTPPAQRAAGLAQLGCASVDGRTRLRQKATFHPRGLLGHLYWWSIAPFHGVVFGGMSRNLVEAAEAATPA